VLYLLLLLIAGCGRVGFDALGDASPPYGDVPPPYEPGRFPAGLVAWWPLDDDPSGGSTRDVSGNEHLARCTRCPSRVVGHSGGAFDFDEASTHLFRVADDGAFRLTSGFTVMNWVFARRRFPFASFSKAAGTFSGDSWEIGTLDTLTHSYNTGDPPALDASTQIPLNTWIHVAGTWDPSGMKRLVIDGQTVATWTGRTNEFDAHDVLIGGEEDATQGMLTLHEGLLDDVQVYARALSDAEIQSIIELQSAPP
jgi:hypothetical protein